MTIRTTKGNWGDLQKCIPLVTDLWPDISEEEAIQSLESCIEKPSEELILAYDNNNIVAFSMVSIRVDWVEGSRQSPTGYLEAVYVAPEYRGSGIAQQMLDMAYDWCREQGCTQMGSDTEITNEGSVHWHLKAGFSEVNRIVTFIKDL